MNEKNKICESRFFFRVLLPPLNLFLVLLILCFFVLRRPFFWIFSSPPTRTVETPYIHAHSAKPILNQNNQTNLTRYVSLSRVSSYPIWSPTATYTRRNQRAFWKMLEVRSSRADHHIVVVLSHQPLVIY